EQHRRDTATGADQHGFPGAATEFESASQRAEAAEPVADLHREHLPGAAADRLQDHLDVLAFRAVDREGAAQNWTSRPSEVDELARTHGRCNLRGAHPDHEHAPGALAFAGHRRVKHDQDLSSPPDIPSWV